MTDQIRAPLAFVVIRPHGCSELPSVAAIVDIGLGDGNGRALCDELSSRNISFVVYSGHTRPLDLDVHFIEIPTPITALVEAIEKLYAPDHEYLSSLG